MIQAIVLYQGGEQWKTITEESAMEAEAFIRLIAVNGVEDDQGEIWKFIKARVDCGSLMPRVDIFLELTGE